MSRRLALIAVLSTGLLLTGGGVAFAQSGSSGPGNATASQYAAPQVGQGGVLPNAGSGTQGVQGVTGQGGFPGTQGVAGQGGFFVIQAATGQGGYFVTATGQSGQQGAFQTRGVGFSQTSGAPQENGDGLPFTGFAAIPLLLVGAGLLVVGTVTRRRLSGSAARN